MTLEASTADGILDQVTRKLSEKQIISIVDSARRKLALWVGAVSAGKTIASLFAFLIALRVAPKVGQVVIIGKTLQTIERNVIDQLRTRAIFGALADQVIHTTGSNRAFILGREVSLIGANNKAAEERIRGGTFSLVYVDEATLLPELFWGMLVTRLRVGGARLIATTNPASRNHWLRRKWMLRADEVGLISFHLTMFDNPLYFPGADPGPAYIEDMERTYPPGPFRDRFILGEWANAEGAIYPDWNPDIGGGNVIRFDDMPAIERVIGLGIDYGTQHPFVALMLGLTAERAPGSWDRFPRLVLMDELRDDPEDPKANPMRAKLGIGAGNLAPSQHSAMVARWLYDEAHVPTGKPYERPRYIIVDPAAKQFREQLRNDHRMTTTKGDNEVLAGIGDVASLIAGRHPLGGSYLQATDRCVGWNTEITEYRWSEKPQDEGNDEPLKERDDSMDAGRYVIRTPRSLWRPQFRTAYNLPDSSAA